MHLTVRVVATSGVSDQRSLGTGCPRRGHSAVAGGLDESPIVESEEVRPGIVLDFDANDNVVGIEILDLSGRVSEEMIRNFKFETA